MSDEIHQLVYVSCTAIEGDEGTYRRAIEDILAVARERNARLGVTGALLCNREYFAQVLEGPREAVEEIYESIQCDERHTGTTVLRFRPAPRRDFPDWTMAYEGHDSEALATFSRLTDEARLKLETLDGLNLIALLQRHLLSA